MAPDLSRRTAVVSALLWLTTGATACGGRPGAPAANSQPAAAGAWTFTPAPVDNPFDSLYAGDFALSELSADPVPELPLPAPATGLDDAVPDPTYGTLLYRATDATAGQGERMRHEYSRRQAFNADNTRFLAQDGAGAWHLHDATTFTRLEVLPPLAGDCEPLWHATDPQRLHYTSRNGGTTWWSLDLSTGASEVLIDLTGKTPWPEATSLWTKGEGTTSADGRYLTLMATSYNESTQATAIHGLVVVDLLERSLIGTLDAAEFPVPHAVPDHVSTSASGRHAVVSWLAGQGGTVAYSRDFSSSRVLAEGSEHSDLAFGPRHEDLLIYADYTGGSLLAIDVDTGESFALRGLYPAGGESYALHISGQAFDRPGWAVVSTYGDNADYGATYPAPTVRPEYRKVWLIELIPNGRALNVAHTRVRADSAQEYFAEPQASASRDLSRIIVARDAGSGAIEDDIIGLPSWVTD